jgi:hypothetical protein
LCFEASKALDCVVNTTGFVELDITFVVFPAAPYQPLTATACRTSGKQ